MKKINTGLIRGIISVALFGIIIWKLDLGNVLQVFSKASWVYLFPAFLFVIFQFTVSAILAKFLLGGFVSVNLLDIVRVNFSTRFLSHITPSRLSGLVGKPLLLSRITGNRMTMEDGAVFTIFANLVNSSRILVFGGIGLGLFFWLFNPAYRLVVGGSLIIYFILCLVALILIFQKNSLGTIKYIGKKFFDLLPEFHFLNSLTDKLTGVFQELEDSKMRISSDGLRVTLYWVLLWTVVTVTSAARLWFLFKAFDVDINLSILFFLPILAYSVTILPISIGGMGTAEMSGLYAFTVFGIDKEIAFSAILLDRVLSMYLFAMIGAFTISGFDIGGNS